MKYTLEPGRVIACDGVAIAYLCRVNAYDPTKKCPLALAEADTLAVDVVAGLNALTVLEDAETLLTRCSFHISDGGKGNLGESSLYHRIQNVFRASLRAVASRQYRYGVKP
jgi:hypothetical protein